MNESLESLAVIARLYQHGQISKDVFKFLAGLIVERYVDEMFKDRLSNIEKRLDNLLERVMEARV